MSCEHASLSHGKWEMTCWHMVQLGSWSCECVVQHVVGKLFTCTTRPKWNLEKKMGNFDAHGVGKNTPWGNCPFDGEAVGILSRDALDKCAARMRASLDVVCNSIARAHAWLWEMGKWGFSGGWKKNCEFLFALNFWN